MLKVQNLLAQQFELKAKLEDKTGGMSDVLKQIDAAGKSAEND